MRYIKQSAIISVLLLVLCGCGQRGPLFLPEEPPTENKPSQNNVTTPSTNNILRSEL